jgi:chorismate synthase
MFRFLTAGESHGRAIAVIVDGVPAGLALSAADLARDLRRRQLGYGRGQRMAIEKDAAEIQSGVRHGVTLGSPILLTIQNRDWPNWQHTMAVEADPAQDAGGARRPPVTRPRPGPDLSAGRPTDLRDVLERASARETAARVAAGAIAKRLLHQVGVGIASHVIEIGGVRIDWHDVSFAAVESLPDDDELRCVDERAAAGMRQAVDRARAAGDTVGGAIEVIAHRVPPGLGSHVQWDRKIDGRLAQALMSIPAIKAVGFGLGPGVAAVAGSQAHDEIVRSGAMSSGTIPGLSRPTNRAGGVEGGVTNGEDVRVTVWMKPISTLMKPLRSVDLHTMAESAAAIERSDVCAVPAAGVVAEAMVAITLADALLDKFGRDTVDEIVTAWQRYTASLEARLRPEVE